MTTHTKRLSAGAGTTVLLLALIAGCSSDASIEEFCTEGKAITEGTALDDIDYTDSEAVSKAAEEMIGQIKSLKAPDEIADDWAVVTDAMDQYLTAIKDIDVTSDTAADDIAAVTELMSSEKVTTASENVETFTAENCEA